MVGGLGGSSGGGGGRWEGIGWEEVLFWRIQSISHYNTSLFYIKPQLSVSQIMKNSIVTTARRNMTCFVQREGVNARTTSR